MRVVVLIGMAATVFAGVAQAQKRPVSKGRLAGEVAAGALGIPIGFAVGYTVGSGFRPHGSSTPGVAVGFAGPLAGPATAVNWVGNGGPSHGNFGWTIAGTALGYGATFLTFPLARKLPETGKLKLLATIATTVLPAIGATIAYNATRK